MVPRSCRALAAVVLPLAVAILCASASAAGLDDPVDQWQPFSDSADWVYGWSDTAYSPEVRKEHYTVAGRSGNLFRLSWDEVDPPADQTPSSGTIDYQQTQAGLVNVNYQSTPPPVQFPILCASASSCGNSLAGMSYLLIWGTRSPVLAEPLLQGTRWSSLGGANNDVSSDNRYVGQERVVVPAFPQGIEAARVRSSIVQAGALGDPYGSGTRSVWWVRGVGPVRIVFQHAGGETSEANLLSTNLKPLPLPGDTNYFPLVAGDVAKYRWRNSRHMRRWAVQRFTVAQVVNNSARVDVKRVSGPINVAGSYTFSSRLGGITNLSAFTKAATTARFPRLGPRGASAANRRHFFTPFDLMSYGFNPVITSAPAKGQSWRSSRAGRDWDTYGVTGVTRVAGVQQVRTPAGRYEAVVVRSTLREAGFPFGSGTRTMWFAPGRGLVKLVFRHGDGSVSTVERTR